MLQAAEVDSNTFRTTRQIKLKLNSGSSETIPVGTCLTEINGLECNTNLLQALNENNFENAKIVLPRRPPYLPQYLVVEISGYSSAGGPPSVQV